MNPSSVEVKPVDADDDADLLEDIKMKLKDPYMLDLRKKK